MVNQYLKQSPLSHLHLGQLKSSDNPSIYLWENQWVGQINLRMDISDAETYAKVKNILGVDFGNEVNSVYFSGEKTLLCLGPDEWLFCCDKNQVEQIHEMMNREIGGDTHISAVNLSDARVQIGLAGPMAREVLSKGCSIDFHPKVFSPGKLAQTQLARCNVIVEQVGDYPVYKIHVARSFADYAWRWLHDACKEYSPAYFEPDQ